MNQDPVRSVFPQFNSDLEGVVRWPYLDTKGLPTVAIGRQIIGEADMLSLPWQIDGVDATARQISDDYARIKAAVPAQLAQPERKKFNAFYYRTLTRVRLSDDGILQITLALFDLNQRWITKRLPQFPAWPADARLALHSMVWAAGIGGVFGTTTRVGYPKFLDWARKDPPGFYGCANESDLDTSQDSNIKRRNARQRALFRNAAVVAANHWDINLLHYPEQLSEVKEPGTF